VKKTISCTPLAPFAMSALIDHKRAPQDFEEEEFVNS